MEFARALARFLLIAQILMAFITQTSAYDFYVGGKDGWALNPSETYNNWAQRNRFQVYDKLVFKYNNGEDSVLVVNKEDYDTCNTSNPIRKMEGGDSAFIFDRSGHFFFISGAHDRCEKGEKMVVVVMAKRNGKKTPPPLPPLLPPSSFPSPSPLVAEAPAAFGPAMAPSPLSGASSSSSSCGLSVGRVWFGVVAFVLGGVYFI